MKLFILYCKIRSAGGNTNKKKEGLTVSDCYFDTASIKSIFDDYTSSLKTSDIIVKIVSSTSFCCNDREKALEVAHEIMSQVSVQDADFKNYMFNELFGSDNLDSRLKTIKEYIRSFKNDNDIRNDYSLSLTEVLTDQNDNLVVNGLNIMASDEIDINSYFTSALIRLPYRISRDNYIAVKYKKDDPKREIGRAHV